MMDKAVEFLKNIIKLDMFPDVPIVQGVSSNSEIIINGKKFINFASANYLGLANNNEIKEEVILGIKRYGLHPTGARLVSGTLDVHKELERKTAEFKDCEDSMIFQAGILANIGVIPAIINVPDLTQNSSFKFVKNSKSCIFSDELNHASIIDGCRLANSDKYIYRHSDMEDLEKKLKYSKAKRKLIITDGIFSMDGDIASLPQIINLAKKYEAMLMVDDAHASGVLGENGRGTLEYFGLKNGVDINMGTFSKSCGLTGGFISGSKDLIDYLRITTRTYIFSGATFGSIALGVLKSLEIIQKDKKRRYKLWRNSNYLRDKIKELGFNTLTSKDTPIIPILIGSEKKAILLAQKMFGKGILAPPIRWPAVEKGKSRIRISVTSAHSKKQLDRLIETLAGLKTSL